MIDLSNATFIIPIRIESEDRLRNVVTTTAFLLENFKTNIIIKEEDKVSRFNREAVPILNSILSVPLTVNHIFEYSEEPLFHRQRVLNEMIAVADTEIVVNYDCDAILPIESIKLAYDSIMDGTHDVVYPYGWGNYQYQVKPSDDVVSDFLENYDYAILKSNSTIYDAQSGWVQFFKRSVYIEGGMENENFRAYAPEDKERLYRFEKLGYNVGRIFDFIYHLEHARGQNSWFTNPHMEHNNNVWEGIQKMSKQQLVEYYSTQKYLKKYR
jgi:hypothetical protein